jgi:uncharacterized cupin superfamily protein
MKVVNLLDLERGEENDRDGFRLFGRGIGDELGAELLGCGVYDLPPGEQLWPYHFHLGREEWAVVVVGTPTVRAPDGERALRPGDLVAFAADATGAHTFLNHSDGDARVAIFSTLGRGSAWYVDSGKVGVPGGHMFRIADAVDYWEGEGSG